MRRTLAFAAAAVAVYLVCLGAAVAIQRDLLFARDATPADPRTAGIVGLSRIEIRTEDGERLVAWYLAPREDRPLLLYFHGNAGNLARAPRLARFRLLAGEGYGLLAIQYRGYGGSTGLPTEAGLRLDARAAHAEAVRRHGAERIVAYGESLGTGVAVRLATERPVRAVVLEAPYTSIVEAAQRFFPLFPVDRLLEDRFQTDAIIAGLRVPLLILHGTADFVIPSSHAVRLHALATTRRRLVLVTDAGHEEALTRAGLPHLVRFLREVDAGTVPSAERTEIPMR